jgi:hypothetical protein
MCYSYYTEYKEKHMTTEQLEQLFANIAAQELNIDTLKTQNSGQDFHEVAVWCVRNALAAAYTAGNARGRLEQNVQTRCRADQG